MDYATAIAAGVTLGIMQASGTLQVVGSPDSPTPGPGSGSGQGVIS